MILISLKPALDGGVSSLVRATEHLGRGSPYWQNSELPQMPHPSPYRDFFPVPGVHCPSWLFLSEDGQGMQGQWNKAPLPGTPLFRREGGQKWPCVSEEWVSSTHCPLKMERCSTLVNQDGGHMSPCLLKSLKAREQMSVSVHEG